MSGPSRIPDWNLLTVERHTDFDVTDEPKILQSDLDAEDYLAAEYDRDELRALQNEELDVEDE